MTENYRIQVFVKPEYLANQSEPDNNRYVFAYHIRILNVGLLAAQLISRHWMITDGNGDVDEVIGEGVVGEQPLIDPGGEHFYSSFCILETPVGMMRGSYQMIASDGSNFEAEIPSFSLAVPNSLN